MLRNSEENKKRKRIPHYTRCVCVCGVSERKNKSAELVKPFKGVIFLIDIIVEKMPNLASCCKG